MTLHDKITHSIDLIRKAERLSITMQPDYGFYVGFSGGKDSQAVLELVKMAGVKYRVAYNVTTNDPSDNVRFIKNYYPDVEFNIPEKSYFQLISQKGLPTMRSRWCCAILKETAGVGYVVLTGVRKEESIKRSKYEEISKFCRTKGGREIVDLDKMETNEFRCVGGKDKFMVYPILEWTEKDVWDFITLRGLPVNPCYKTRKRVGCVFCPFAKKKEILAYCDTHPHLKDAFIHAIDRYLEIHRDRQQLPSAYDYFDWWLSKDSLKNYKEKQRQTELTL